MKKFWISLLVILILSVLGSYSYLNWQWSAYGNGGILLVPKGSSMSQVAYDLEKLGLVRSAWSFSILAKLKKAEKSIKVGEYKFEANITAAKIIDKLVKGERFVHKMVIPEGYNFDQIAQAIANTQLASLEEVQKKMNDPQLLKVLPFEAISLEGYLYPATYDYDRNTSLDFLLRQMLESFEKNFDEQMKTQAKEMGWSIPQVVTLASIIEKETGQASERRIISSVFHNRLKKGMLLQTDPTVIYGLKDFDGNLRKSDMQNPHPYNTYVHSGLPPSPIASPGKESLAAALNPASTEYLYFVSKGDGSHYFSKTYEEHLQAVKKFQL